MYADIITSFVEIPDLLTLLVYTYGCKLGCPYCYNRELWSVPKQYLTNDDVMDVLTTYNKSIAMIDAVSISGAEPLLQVENITNLVKRIKDYDNSLYVNIDTSITQGSIKLLLKYVDRIALTIKESDLWDKFRDDVNNNLQILKECKKDKFLQVRLVFTNDNCENLIKEAMEVLDKIGDKVVNIRVSPTVVTESNNGKFKAITNSTYTKNIETVKEVLKDYDLEIVSF